MSRFFSPAGNITKDSIIISDKDQVHHMKDVLRLKTKDEIMVFDDLGREYFCVIEKLSFEGAVLKIRHTKEANTIQRMRISVACAIPKKSKMDDIVDKLTQLGVDRIIPLVSERVIVKLDEKKKISRKERWEKIALSSAKQTQRAVSPVIEAPKSVEEVLAESGDFDLKLIAALIGERKSLRSVLEKSKPKNILVLIGPEGDFTQDEVNIAKKAGCLLVSLGDLVLRVDTAAIATASFITLYENS